MAALAQLRPVRFSYKTAKGEDRAGFVAEESPELVTAKDRKAVAAMDVAALLTRVIQEQQKTIAELRERVEAPEAQQAQAP